MSRVQTLFTDRLGGFSTGDFSSLNLGRTDEDDIAALRRNIDVVRGRVGVRPVVAVHQVHGNDVLPVDEKFLAGWGDDSWLGDLIPGAPALTRADAMVTASRGVALMIRVADCVPVLLADDEAGVIGAAHAGRVGLLAGVLTQTVTAMREIGAGSIRAVIGPHICGSCYEVPAEMADQVASEHPNLVSCTSWGTASLDLGQGCLDELTSLGVTVDRDDPCTYETQTLFSHRRQQGRAGRQAGIIALV